MSKLKLVILEDPQLLVSVESLNDLCQSNPVSQCFFELNDGRYRFVNYIFNPLFCFPDMTQVLICLQELSLLVHPISVAPSKASGQADLAATSGTGVCTF